MSAAAMFDKTTTALDVASGYDLTGKTVVVTGATAGLGRESARAFAAAGATVIVTGRSPAALEDTTNWITESVPGALTDGVVMDLTSLASVRRAGAHIASVNQTIDILMNNAGVMFTPLERTEDGFESQIGINHLGHFALTRLLEPCLIAAGTARVVIMSSGGHKMGDIDHRDPNWETRGYDKFLAYGASKTANLLHMVSLGKRLTDEGVTTVSVNPGAVATSLARHMSSQDFSALRQYAREATADDDSASDGFLDFKMPEAGAGPQVWAALEASLEGSRNVYIEEFAASDDVVDYALDPESAEKLWVWSGTMTAS
ncbi:MAG: short-chain dehydrogenase/reductase [Marmoricola sp.]|nr:short-chain dehydrogenase/reductase [Marmoricola sp.]